MARPGVGPPDAGLPHGEHGPPRDGVQDDMALAHYMGNPLPEEEEDSATSTPTAAAAAAASQSTSAVQTSSVEQISTTTSECRSSSTQVTISTSVPVVENNHTLPSSSHSSECSLPTAPLTNQEQVGDSIIGTLCQSPLPKWLEKPDGTKYTSAPWKNATTKKTDPTLEGHIPVTNVTRRYDFTVSRGTLSPDGVLRDVILVNNQYPGPTIEANFGDVVEIRVVNNITNPEEGTALHWHGMLQRGMPWEDGAPGMTQCPIAPGAEFTYSWRAETYGTSYWHAHYSAQYTAGVVGAMVIHGPSVSDYDVDIGPVMLNDWNHIPYFSMVQNVVGTDFSKLPPLSDNGLINGRGRFDCSVQSYDNSSEWIGSNLKSDLTWTCVEGAERAKFRFQSGKTHRLRLINQGADGIQKFSIDDHTMTVIATDFVPMQPYETTIVTLGVGQRTDVLVTANSDPKSAVWMRTQLPGGPEYGGLGPYGLDPPRLGQPMPAGVVYPDVLAALYYEDADTSLDPITTSPGDDITCDNDDIATTRPDFASAPSTEPARLDLVLTLALNESGNFEWQTNGQAYRANYNDPLLYKVAAGQTEFPEDPQYNTYNMGDSSAVVLNVTNLTPFTHPFHLHGHTFFVLGVGGAGTVWDDSVVEPENPMRRDTQIIPSGRFAALQFEGDNPGVWPFHCHAAWHLSSGLSITLISRPNDIVQIPDGMKAATCDAWELYTSSTVVDQIDSGS